MHWLNEDRQGSVIAVGCVMPWSAPAEGVCIKRLSRPLATVALGGTLGRFRFSARPRIRVSCSQPASTLVDCIGGAERREGV